MARGTKRKPSTGSPLPLRLLLAAFLAAVITNHRNFVVVLLPLQVVTVSLSSSSVVEAFVVVPKASFQNRVQSRLLSTSASAAYLESISYKPPTLEDGLLGATSKYLDAISSVSAQLSSSINGNGNMNMNMNMNINDYYAANTGYASSIDYAFSEAASNAAPPTYEAATTSVPFSEDQLVNEVVQRVTQEFSSALEAFGGETYESFVDGVSSTVLSQSMPQYIWDMDDFDLDLDAPAAKPAAKKAAKAVRDAVSNNNNNNNNNSPPEESMQELSNKLEGSFRNFKENLSSSTQSVKSTFTDTLRREASQPNAAVTTAKQQENIEQMRQRLDEGQLNLNPEVLSHSAKEAASTMAEAANKALVESTIALPPEAETAVNSLTGSLSETASGAVKSLSETASHANSALSETQQGIQKSFGSFVTNTNQGIGKALSSFAESTNAATHSFTESASSASSAVTSALGGGASSLAKSASAASSAVTNAIGGGASSLAESASAASSAVTSTLGGGASSIAETATAATATAATAVGGAASGTAKALVVGASSAKQSVGAAGMAVKTAVVTAKPGTAATAGKVSAVALSANQGFGMPGNAYGGGGDVAGLAEMVVATVASLPRAVVDAAVIETNNPNAMDDLMEGVSSGLYNDILVPLSKPLRESATAAAAASSTPLEQAQAVLETSQRVMALVVSIPRAVVEGVTGQPITDFQARVAQADINALAQQLSGFASTVATLLISFLKLVAQTISYFVAAATSQGAGGAAAAASMSQQQDTMAKLVSFLLEDLLPAIIDGLAMVLQQFVLLLLEGGSAIVSAL
eukprot:jgi/Psemu1/285456/fgenesh1_pg.88_\